MSDLPRSFGAYQLVKLLARGGMGEIFLGRTTGVTGFEKYYAVKKLIKKFTADADVTGRFVDEAKLGARLQHPNIVQVYDLGKVGDELYMATEFVDGFDLRRVLRFCHEKKKRIPLDIALFIVREILSGLAYAHRQVDADGQLINLIHRDISPQNVLVSFEGEVKIIDFGLAKSTQRTQETQANVLLGNFGYMSPEQARGTPLDVRTDVYSAGIVLFELVTNTKRFVDENPLRLLEMVARPSPIVPSDRLPNVPKAVDRIFSKATHTERDHRYQTAETFRDELNAALYQLNPKSSREQLAQFLSHLFLGGQAPAAVDPDVLNKSVALQMHTLHASSEALRSSADGDIKNRALAAPFADNAPQTDSLELHRSVRIGDQLSHDQLVNPDPATIDIDATRWRASSEGPSADPLASTDLPVTARHATPELPMLVEENAIELLEPLELESEVVRTGDTSSGESLFAEWSVPVTAAPVASQDLFTDLQRDLDRQFGEQLSGPVPVAPKPTPKASEEERQRQEEHARLLEAARRQDSLTTFPGAAPRLADRATDDSLIINFDVVSSEGPSLPPAPVSVPPVQVEPDEPPVVVEPTMVSGPPEPYIRPAAKPAGKAKLPVPPPKK
jgi:serine/threonine protein kinase